MSEDTKNNEYDPWAKSSFSPATKAEQNQKIVDILIQKYIRKMPEPGVSDSMQNDDWHREQFHLEHYIRLALNMDINELIQARHFQDEVKHDG